VTWPGKRLVGQGVDGDDVIGGLPDLMDEWGM
jgi:hypothetical protein